jgi:hypothetical protein
MSEVVHNTSEPLRVKNCSQNCHLSFVMLLHEWLIKCCCLSLTHTGCVWMQLAAGLTQL